MCLYLYTDFWRFIIQFARYYEYTTEHVSNNFMRSGIGVGLNIYAALKSSNPVKGVGGS